MDEQGGSWPCRSSWRGSYSAARKSSASSKEKKSSVTKEIRGKSVTRTHEQEQPMGTEK